MVGFALRRRHIWWIVTSLLAVGIAVAGGALYYEYRGVTFGECKTVIRRSIPSPDGSRSIVIFGRECGATVGFNTQASIAPAGSTFAPEKDPAFFVVSGSPKIVAGWLGNGVVEISLIAGGGQVIRSDLSVGDIKVEYK